MPFLHIQVLCGIKVNPRIETACVFTKDMNDEIFEKINDQRCTQGSAILKIKYYNPKNLIVQISSLRKK